MITPEKLAAATVSLSALVGVFALLMFVTKYAKMNMETATSMAFMLAVVIALSKIISSLSELDVDSAIGVSASIATLLLSLSASMAILQNAGNVSWKTIGKIAVLTALVAGIGGMLWLFYDILALDPESCILIAISLSTLLLSLSASCAILSVAGEAGQAAFIGIGVLAVLIAAIALIVGGLGALQEKVFDLESFIDKGMPILEKIGYALGSFAGNIVKGFTSSILDIIPLIGEKFSLFWERIQPFIKGVINIPKEAVIGTARLAEIMVLISAAEIINAVSSFASFLHGGSSLIKVPVPSGACKTVGCIPQQSVDFCSNNLSFVEPSPELEKYYDIVNRWLFRYRRRPCGIYAMLPIRFQNAEGCCLK